ncbi:MAG: hypothetical protein HUU08_12755 [Candidatus Brocadia sp.]|nr:hypothetical protein [Candidatus Brocadia sp.]
MDFRIVKKLRKEGFEVISILEKYRLVPSDRRIFLSRCNSRQINRMEGSGIHWQDGQNSKG